MAPVPAAPSDEAIRSFLKDRTEPLVMIPAEHRAAYAAGKIAVLTCQPELRAGDEIVWEMIGFTDRDTEALAMLSSMIEGLLSYSKLDVLYYSFDIWPPALGKASSRGSGQRQL